MLGRALIRDFMATISSQLLPIRRNGLRSQTALITEAKSSSVPPCGTTNIVRSHTEATTTTKSSKFHSFLRQLPEQLQQKPYAMVLRMPSSTKAKVVTRLIESMLWTRSESRLCIGLWNTSGMHETRMSSIMMMLKALLCVTFQQSFLNLLSCPKM